MKRMTMTIVVVCVLAAALNLNAQEHAVESPYALKLGFPADNETIQRAQDATDLRRAIEAYKFFYPTIATEAVIQQFEPHGAVPNQVGIIMPQDPEQQFSVANQDTPYDGSPFFACTAPKHRSSMALTSCKTFKK